MLGVGVFGAVAGVGAGFGTDICGARVSVGVSVLGAGVVCAVGAVMGAGVLGVSVVGVLGVGVSSAGERQPRGHRAAPGAPERRRDAPSHTAIWPSASRFMPSPVIAAMAKRVRTCQTVAAA